MILFHGCGMKDPGHYWFAPGMQTSRYSFRVWRYARIVDNPYEYVPWGYAVDGGLAPHGEHKDVQGRAGFAQNVVVWDSATAEWWSALSWWDRSVDVRPGSNATFVTDARVAPHALLQIAREGFPEVFARMKYEIVLPDVGAL